MDATGTGQPQPSLREVEQLLQTLLELHATALGPLLRALYLYGSLVTGDFAPDRSDVDVLAVLTTQPDEDLLVQLEALHEELSLAHPTSRGRVEVEYVALATLRQYAAGGVPGAPATIARVSPGEQLHLLPATAHRVLSWASVHRSGRPLMGPSARDLIPRMDDGLVRAALLAHVRDWPVWVRSMTATGGQAYAVLTLCRAVVLLENGEQVSKKAAATRVSDAYPAWADLALWARGWWYDGGRDDEPARMREVQRFVEEMSARLLAR